MHIGVCQTKDGEDSKVEYLVALLLNSLHGKNVNKTLLSALEEDLGLLYKSMRGVR